MPNSSNLGIILCHHGDDVIFLIARKTKGNEPLMDYSQFHVVAFGEHLCQKEIEKEKQQQKLGERHESKKS
jgi:hypothetical protein